jgi:hypothetical protein
MIGIEDMMFGHLVAPEEDVIGGMAGHFTRKFVKERGAVRSKIDTMDAAVAYATNNTMPAAVMEDLESI